jgi:hypothetical protein
MILGWIYVHSLLARGAAYRKKEKRYRTGIDDLSLFLRAFKERDSCLVFEALNYLSI